MHTPAKLALALLGLTAAPMAAAELTVTVAIEDHEFTPSEITVPAGETVRLVVENQDSTPEEFESHSLHQEKILMGGQTGRFTVGPLEPGRYEFFGEFHPDSARGFLVAQ